MKLLIPAIVLVVALVAAIARTPASYVVAQATPAAAPVEFYEVSGTLGSGQIGRLRIRTLDIDDIQWQLRPADLLGLAVGADTQAKVMGSRISGHLSAGLFDPIAGHDIRASATLAQIKDALKIPFLPIDGNLFLRIDAIAADTQWVTALQGQLQLVDTVWALGKPEAPLGEFQADLSLGDDGIITAQLRDVDAKLKIDGQLTVSPDRSYAISARIRGTADTPTVVSNNLRALGRPDPEGWYTLNYSGRLR